MCVHTVLEVDCVCVYLWRAVGDQNRVYEDFAAIREWHVVMAQLTIGVNVVLGDSSVP